MVVVDRCDIICTPTSVFRQGSRIKHIANWILFIGYARTFLDKRFERRRYRKVEVLFSLELVREDFFSQTVAQRLTMILLNRQVVNRINEHRIGWQSKIFKICKYTRKKALFEQISERILVICFTNNIRNSMKRIFLHST